MNPLASALFSKKSCDRDWGEGGGGRGVVFMKEWGKGEGRDRPGRSPCKKVRGR